MGEVIPLEAPSKRIIATNRAQLSKQTASVTHKPASKAVCYAGYCLLIVPLWLLPWLLGGNRLPFLLIATTLLVFSAAIGVFAYWHRGLPSAFSLWSWLPLAVIALWLSPVASSLKRALIQANGLQVGHDINLEFQAFAVALGVLAIVVAIPMLLTDVSRIRGFIVVLLGSSFLQVVYATYVLSGGDRILYWPSDDMRLPTGEGIVATANFANRNHFAGHLEMMLFLALGVLIGYYLKNSLRNRRQSLWSRVAKAVLGPEGKLRAVIIVLTAGLVMTQSRTGNIAFFSTLALAALLLYKFLPEARRAITVLLVSIVVIDVAIISNLVGLEHVVDRIATTKIDEELRVDFNALSLQMLSDYWLTGIGGGNYVSFVGAYQAMADEIYLIYAHNDVLQMMIELSVPAFLLLVVYVILSVRAGIYAFIERSQPFYRGIGLGAACATVSLSIHSFSDFNHQIPANSFLFVSCTTLCWLCRFQNAKQSHN